MTSMKRKRNEAEKPIAVLQVLMFGFVHTLVEGPWFVVKLNKNSIKRPMKWQRTGTA